MTVWNYALTAMQPFLGLPHPPQERRRARELLAMRLGHALEALGDFGCASSVSISSERQEHELFMSLKGDKGVRGLFRYLRQTPDLTQLTLGLNVRCVAKARGREPRCFKVHSGAKLVIELEPTGGSLHALFLRLFVKTDLYTPGIHTGQDLASVLNGERLGRFLSRLERTVPARFLTTASAGRGLQVSRFGFEMGAQRSAA